MTDTIAVRQMPETRRKILRLLKQDGPMTADQLSQALDITSMGVRQHLVALERDGLISYSSEQRGMGRPSYVYSLTPEGDELFPRSYPQFVNSLLEATRQAYGEEGLETVFQKRNESLKSIYEARLGQHTTLSNKVAELADIRTEEGYMANWSQKDKNTFHLSETNCAICEVAKTCLKACGAELELFQAVLPEADVKRESHIMSGDRTCTYVIRHKSS